MGIEWTFEQFITKVAKGHEEVNNPTQPNEVWVGQESKRNSSLVGGPSFYAVVQLFVDRDLLHHLVQLFGK
jgi:hypothetical protein